MSLLRTIVLFGVSAVFLTACGEIREDLGLGRNAPDEFAVVDRAPLAMPPDYGLRPPRPGAPRPQDVDVNRQASAIILGSGGSASASAPSKGERALLEASGAMEADPKIRETVERETAQKVVASDHLVQKLMDWSGEDEKPATTVDAAAEAERLKKAKEENLPINSGATPVIEKQSSGWLGL